MRRGERELLKYFRALDAAQQDTLVAFAEFLAGKAASRLTPLQAPLPIPRPPEEKVVHAIKRLRATYPMLDHGKLLHEVSEHMTQHMVLGRAAAEVIDDLEEVFRRHYEALASGRS